MTTVFHLPRSNRNTQHLLREAPGEDLMRYHFTQGSNRHRSAQASSHIRESLFAVNLWGMKNTPYDETEGC